MGHIKVVELFIKSGANLDAVDKVSSMQELYNLKVHACIKCIHIYVCTYVL